MSTETFQIVVVVLLAIILLLQLLNMVFQRSAVDGIQEALDEADAKKRKKNHDIGDFIERKKYKDALHIADKRLITSPDDPGLYWYKGIALYHLENWEESLSAFKRSVELEPLYEKDLASYFHVLNQKLGSSV